MIYLSSMVLHHVRTLVVCILCIGGMISFGVVYAILSSPYNSNGNVPEEGANVAVANNNVASVFSWFDAKQKAQGDIPSISNSVFSTPSGL